MILCQLDDKAAREGCLLAGVRRYEMEVMLIIDEEKCCVFDLQDVLENVNSINPTES